MTYIIVLKVIKFSEDRLNCFSDIWQEPSGGGGANAPPVQIELSQTECITFFPSRQLQKAKTKTIQKPELGAKVNYFYLCP